MSETHRETVTKIEQPVGTDAASHVHTDKTREMVGDPHLAPTHEKTREIVGDPHLVPTHEKTRDLAPGVLGDGHSHEHTRDLNTSNVGQTALHDPTQAKAHDISKDEPSTADKLKSAVGLGEKHSPDSKQST